MKNDNQSWHEYISQSRNETNIENMMSSLYDDRIMRYQEKLDQLRFVYKNILDISYGNVKFRGSPTVIVKYLLPKTFKNRHKYGKYGFKLQCLITGGFSKSIQLDEYESYGIDLDWQDTGGPFGEAMQIGNTAQLALSKYYELQSNLYRIIHNTQIKYIDNHNNAINAEWKKRYSEYLSSSEWKGIRESVLRIDQYACTNCSTEQNLQVHHTTYNNVGQEMVFELVTLCRSCHIQIHKMDYDNRKEKELHLLSVSHGRKFLKKV